MTYIIVTLVMMIAVLLIQLGELINEPYEGWY
jgi:hypothetical protein